MSLIEVIKYDCLLSLVPFPPFVGHFLIRVRVLLSCCFCLSSTSRTPIPVALTRGHSVYLEEIVFTYLLEVSIVSNPNISRNLFYFSFFS